MDRIIQSMKNKIKLLGSSSKSNLVLKKPNRIESNKEFKVISLIQASKKLEHIKRFERLVFIVIFILLTKNIPVTGK